MNSAGYRFGASDQAFYAPAVLKAIDPALYPRDSALIRSQAHLTLVDDVLGPVLRTRSIPLPAAFVGTAGRGPRAPRRRRAAHRRCAVSDPLGRSRAARGADAAARDQQVGHEHARGLLPSPPARVRSRRAGRSRRFCAAGSWRRLALVARRRHAAPDDRLVVHVLAGRGAAGAGATAPARADRGARDRRGCGNRGRMGADRGTASEPPDTDGCRVARHARREGLSVPAQVAGDQRGSSISPTCRSSSWIYRSRRRAGVAVPAEAGDRRGLRSARRHLRSRCCRSMPRAWRSRSSCSRRASSGCWISSPSIYVVWAAGRGRGGHAVTRARWPRQSSHRRRPCTRRVRDVRRVPRTPHRAGDR